MFYFNIRVTQTFTNFGEKKPLSKGTFLQKAEGKKGYEFQVRGDIVSKGLISLLRYKRQH